MELTFRDVVARAAASSHVVQQSDAREEMG